MSVVCALMLITAHAKIATVSAPPAMDPASAAAVAAMRVKVASLESAMATMKTALPKPPSGSVDIDVGGGSSRQQLRAVKQQSAAKTNIRSDENLDLQMVIVEVSQQQLVLGELVNDVRLLNENSDHLAHGKILNNSPKQTRCCSIS